MPKVSEDILTNYAAKRYFENGYRIYLYKRHASNGLLYKYILCPLIQLKITK